MAQTLNLEDVILAALESRLASVFTAMPGRVKSYTAATQLADIQPAVQGAYVDESGARVVETLPLVPSVPVMFLGGGGFRTTYPVAEGDTCLLVFCNCSIDNWIANGGVPDPADDRRHHLGDAIAIVGVRDRQHALKNVPTDRMSVGSDTGASVEIHQSEVRLGSNSASNRVLTELDASDFRDALDAAIDDLGGPGPASAQLGALATQLHSMGVIGPHAGQKWGVGSSTVKADD